MARPRKNPAASTTPPADPGQGTIFGIGVSGPVDVPTAAGAAPATAPSRRAQGDTGDAWQPPNLGKALVMETIDFGDPDRPKTCLEVDFPILPVNRLAQVEGNAGKPIYQMSKWFARRRSSVFRTLMIAAATKAPDDPVQASKKVWDAYYANHQKAGSFRNFRVLEPFMGGGTTLVEGNRLGFHVSGCDLSPIAWFVCRNELSAVDPDDVRRLFDHVEATVKPQIQPFYTTTCPRGHRGRWVDAATGEVAAGVDPIALPPEQRKKYRWVGPEVIYTFWAKHGHCRQVGCGHRTPVMSDPIVAIKELSTHCMPTTCPHCGHGFRVFLGETRAAPGCQRVNAPSECVGGDDEATKNIPTYTESTKRFADLVRGYGKDGLDETVATAESLVHMVAEERGFQCPKCHRNAGAAFKAIVEGHLAPRPTKSGKSRIVKSAFDRKELGLIKANVAMTVCIDPRWMKGSPGMIGDVPAGGSVTSTDAENVAWYRSRAEHLRLIEVRGMVTPETKVKLADGAELDFGSGNVPGKSEFKCGRCGSIHDLLEATRDSGRSAATMPYAIQCHCPECEDEGHDYGGRYFKSPDPHDMARMEAAEREWSTRSQGDLADFWPKQKLQPAYMTHQLNGGIPNWGYTHWWTMFNQRQRLQHAATLKTITEAREAGHALAVCEQVLGGFQQNLRMACMFSFWHYDYDKLAPALSNGNYHPKSQVVEVSPWGALGYGRFPSNRDTVGEGLTWAREPWDVSVPPEGKNIKAAIGDPILPDRARIVSGSSTDLSALGDQPYDLIITDPPFGKNVFYADLADFFYVWIRIPLVKWYAGTPLAEPWLADRTPHAAEAVPNPIETPDDREDWQTKPRVTKAILEKIREVTGIEEIAVGDPNPCLETEPCDRRYREMLAEVWSECCNRLKPGGLMAFTFHHSEDEPWVDVLQALFEAGFLLVATYPVRSDETKGDSAAFGAKKIEYDIVHVCRKRLAEPEEVAYLKMRNWVKEEAGRLKDLLSDSHKTYAEEGLPESDLRIILIGKSLEFYSRHYGKVLKGSGEVLGVRDALLGVNLLIDDLLMTETGRIVPKAPDEAEPATRLFLKMFGRQASMEKNDCLKAMRGTGYAFDEFESLGWATHESGTMRRAELTETFALLRRRIRKVLRRDLDQAFFCAGCCLPSSGCELSAELDATRTAKQWTPKRAVLPILRWMAIHDPSAMTKQAAGTAATILEAWLTAPVRREAGHQLTIFERLESDALGGNP